MTPGVGVTPVPAQRDSLRDTLRVIQGGGGQEDVQEPQEQAQEAAPAPELLTLAEAARRLEDEYGIIVRPATMRTHKKRHDDFPKGVGEPGKERYAFAPLVAHYVAREKKKA
ncbi:hypothetical protein [Streptomyces sp. PH10-H1]|uniref:hypothetical protein n=1 Tax=Streptomyces sp. PH10-H1 TaxID=3046212 RepID=UPI0024BB2C91|nr:hypothetical protein [Streptomyces sp. PH10-H1]MDJ0347680.1 hypothetical protein [Streptomyces sp. PH10-H1]